MNVTRIVPEKDLKKILTVKRKTLETCRNLSIYMFNTLDEYLDFCTSLVNANNNTYSFFKNSSLYLYKSKYYLCLTVNENNQNSFKSFHYSIIEFASTVSNSELFERKLKEYGKIIFKTNAINNCIRYFN